MNDFRKYVIIDLSLFDGGQLFNFWTHLYIVEF